MIWLLIIPAALYLAIVFGWGLYLAVMSLAPRRQTMHPLVKVHAYALLGFGLAYDCIVLNCIIGTLLFGELPKLSAGEGRWWRRFEWLLTARLQRHHAAPPDSRRYAIARWICTHMLNPFDPKGGHC